RIVWGIDRTTPCPSFAKEGNLTARLQLTRTSKCTPTGKRENAHTPGPCYNPPMHVLLLRLALGLYCVGLVHSVLTVFTKKQTFFRPSAIAVAIGFACHAASIVIRAIELQSIPLT